MPLARPWRGHRSRGRRVRPRGGVHRPGADAAGARPARPQDRVRAYHHRRGGRLRPGGGPADRRDGHAAASASSTATPSSPAASGPHAYCLPVAKREKHRLAVRRAATSGSPKFFLGTDSAPHAVERKESGCGCAGIFNAPFALESYAQVFEEEGALDRLEALRLGEWRRASTGCRSTRGGSCWGARSSRCRRPAGGGDADRAVPCRRDPALDVRRLIVIPAQAGISGQKSGPPRDPGFRRGDGLPRGRQKGSQRLRSVKRI